MKHILHDWSDARSTEILRVLRACAPPGARLLLAEAALPDATADVPAWMAGLDLQVGGLLTAGGWVGGLLAARRWASARLGGGERVRACAQVMDGRWPMGGRTPSGCGWPAAEATGIRHSHGSRACPLATGRGSGTATHGPQPQMMAIVGGRERSVSDWRALLAAGGFRLEAAHPLSSGESIIEAVCA